MQATAEELARLSVAHRGWHPLYRGGAGAVAALRDHFERGLQRADHGVEVRRDARGRLPGAVRPGGFFDTPDTEKGFVMLNLYVALELAAEAAAEGDLATARALLAALRPEVAAWLAESPDDDIADDLTWVDRFIENLDAAQAQATLQLPPPEVVPDHWPAD